MFKGVSPRNVVDEKGTGAATVVAASDAFKIFLSLKTILVKYYLTAVSHICTIHGYKKKEMTQTFALGIINIHGARAKFDTNGDIVKFMEALVCKLEQKTRFANTRVTCNFLLAIMIFAHQ